MRKIKQTWILVPNICCLWSILLLTMIFTSNLSSLPLGSTRKNASRGYSALMPEKLPNHLSGSCSAICLDNNDHCIFGANFDNWLENGYLFVNKRYVRKTTWDPSTSGEYARWISRYGSITFNFVGYQMAWGGMNEAGLMISTMSLNETQGPVPDERSPFETPFWMQYQLDNYSSIEQVIASDAEIRVPESAVDHYMVCDRTGACATIEFLDGKMVHHSGDTLPVKVLTNSTYDVSVRTWEKSQQLNQLPDENSLWRFATAANRVAMFKPSTSADAVAYNFETLEAVSGENTVWSFVFDPTAGMVYFRTNNNPDIRSINFAAFDFSCGSPVKMLDVHADLQGDVSDQFIPYTHKESLEHSLHFFTKYEGFSMSPILVDTLLWGLESFPCQDGGLPTKDDLVRYRRTLSPTISWAGLTLLHRLGPFWFVVVILSLAILFWRIKKDRPSPRGRWLGWALGTALLGPFGLIIYIFNQRKMKQKKLR